MTILQYETQILSDGSIALPLLPEYRNRKVVVSVDEGIDVLDRTASLHSDVTNKTPEQDFLDFCEELAMPALSDDEVERYKYERLRKKHLS
jgi:hypothetical protein